MDNRTQYISQTHNPLQPTPLAHNAIICNKLQEKHSKTEMICNGLFDLYAVLYFKFIV